MTFSSTRAAALLQWDALRVARDARLLVFFTATLAISLFRSDIRALLTNVALLFLPVVVGWSWGADLETGALVPLSLAVDGRLRFYVVRFAVLLGISLAAISPVLLDPRAHAFDRLLVAGGLFAQLCLGFLLVTAARNSHAGWIPVFLALGGVLLPWLRLLRENPGAKPPLWLWILGSAIFPSWSAGIAPESRFRIPWVLLAACWLFAAGTVSILRWRTGALGQRQ